MTKKKKINLEMFKNLSTEEMDDVIKNLKKFNSKIKEAERIRKKEYKPKVEQELGRYVLSRLGINCYQLDAIKFKKLFESFVIRKDEIKSDRTISAKYQLEQIRKLRRKPRNTSSSINSSDINKTDEEISESNQQIDLLHTNINNEILEETDAYFQSK